MCKNAHEKLLEFNVGNVTLDERDPREKLSVLEVETHFLDMTLSDVESDDVEADDVESDDVESDDVEAAPIPSMSCKRKRFEEEEGDREDEKEHQVKVENYRRSSSLSKTR